MNTKYKYSVEEFTKYDHSETWFESLEQAQLWFNKHVQQALFRLDNRCSLIEMETEKQIVRHCIIKYIDSNKVFVEFLLKEYK